jgi:hypothetical protein
VLYVVANNGGYSGYMGVARAPLYNKLNPQVMRRNEQQFLEISVYNPPGSETQLPPVFALLVYTKTYTQHLASHSHNKGIYFAQWAVKNILYTVCYT